MSLPRTGEISTCRETGNWRHSGVACERGVRARQVGGDGMVMTGDLRGTANGCSCSHEPKSRLRRSQSAHRSDEAP
jgi:hypothetical protein